MKGREEGGGNLDHTIYSFFINHSCSFFLLLFFVLLFSSFVLLALRCSLLWRLVLCCGVSCSLPFALTLLPSCPVHTPHILPRHVSFSFCHPYLFLLASFDSFHPPRNRRREENYYMKLEETTKKEKKRRRRMLRRRPSLPSPLCPIA